MYAIAYAHCPAGASGDMFLAAALDAGLPMELLRERLSGLGITGYRLETISLRKQGLAARAFKVLQEEPSPARHWSDIRDLIRNGGLPAETGETALAIFGRLAGAEAAVHGVPTDNVHFHEVGAVDSIVDIVGAAVAWEYFGRPRLTVSPLPLGSGFVDSAHGRLPLPAPATLRLLTDVPVYGAGLEAELLTPTGAAVLTTLASDYGPFPAMTPMAIGIGSGYHDLPDRPNIMRLVLGRSEALTERRLVQAETNLDDERPEVLAHVLARLMAEGARDAWITPVVMKKGRPGVTLAFLSDEEAAGRLADILLAETGSLGVRWHTVTRRELARRPITVDTPWGQAEVKEVDRFGRLDRIPEFEACRRIAERTGVPLRDVWHGIMEAARRRDR